HLRHLVVGQDNREAAAAAARGSQDVQALVAAECGRQLERPAELPAEPVEQVAVVVDHEDPWGCRLGHAGRPRSALIVRSPARRVRRRRTGSGSRSPPGRPGANGEGPVPLSTSSAVTGRALGTDGWIRKTSAVALRTASRSPFTVLIRSNRGPFSPGQRT